MSTVLIGTQDNDNDNDDDDDDDTELQIMILGSRQFWAWRGA